MAHGPVGAIFKTGVPRDSGVAVRHALNRMASTMDYILDTTGSLDRPSDAIAIEKKLPKAFARAAAGTDAATTHAFWEWVSERRLLCGRRGRMA